MPGPYILSGTLNYVIKVLGAYRFFGPSKKDVASQINLDVDRAPLFGTLDDYYTHLKGWKQRGESKDASYLQGDMFGGSSYLLLGPDIDIDGVKQPLLPADQDVEPGYFKTLNFGYVDKDGVLSAVGVQFVPEHPDRWIVSIEKKINHSANERTVSLITPFSLKEPNEEFIYRQLEDPHATNCQLGELKDFRDQLLDSIKHPVVEALVKLITSSNILPPNLDVFALFCHLGETDTSAVLSILEQEIQKPDGLLTILNNPVLKIISTLGVKITSAQLLRFLEESTIPELFRVSQNIIGTQEYRAKVDIYLHFDNWGIKDDFKWLPADIDLYNFQNFIGYMLELSAEERQTFLEKIHQYDPEFNVIKFVATNKYQTYSREIFKKLRLESNQDTWSRLYDLSLTNVGNDLEHATLCHQAFLGNTNHATFGRKIKAEYLATFAIFYFKINPAKLAKELMTPNHNNLAHLLAYSLNMTREDDSLRQMMEEVFSFILMAIPESQRPALLEATFLSIDKVDSKYLEEKLLRIKPPSPDLTLLLEGVDAINGLSTLKKNFQLKEDSIDKILMNVANILENQSNRILKIIHQSAPQQLDEIVKELKKYRTAVYDAVREYLDTQPATDETLEAMNKAISAAEVRLLQSVKIVGFLVFMIKTQIAVKLLQIHEKINPDSLDGFIKATETQLQILAVSRRATEVGKKNLHENLAQLVYLKEYIDPHRLAEVLLTAKKINPAHLLAHSVYLSSDDISQREKMQVIFNLILKHIPQQHQATLIDATYRAINLKNSQILKEAIDSLNPQDLDISLLVNGVETINACWELKKPIPTIFNSENKSQVLKKVAHIVENQSYEMIKRLEEKNPKKMAAILEDQKQYRTAIYAAVTEYLNTDNQTVLAFEKMQKAIKVAENSLLAKTKDDLRPACRVAAMIITNAITLIFTLGLANLYNYKQSEDYFFFSSTHTSKTIKKTDIAVLDEVEAFHKGKFEP